MAASRTGGSASGRSSVSIVFIDADITEPAAFHCGFFDILHRMEGITIIVFTDFFKREKKLYALGDISFARPISFKLAGNILLGIFVYTFPLVKILGVNALLSSPLMAALMVGPAVGFGFLISKPSAIFNNKSFYSFVACQIRYLFSPKYWTDMKSSTINNGDKANGDFRVWIGDTWLDDYGNPLKDEEHAPKSKTGRKSRKAHSRKRK